MLCSDGGEYDKGQPHEEGWIKHGGKGENGRREGSSKDGEGDGGCGRWGVGCQSGGGG